MMIIRGQFDQRLQDLAKHQFCRKLRDFATFAIQNQRTKIVQIEPEFCLACVLFSTLAITIIPNASFEFQLKLQNYEQNPGLKSKARPMFALYFRCVFV